MAPSQSTIKRLFAVSGNRCAYPGCQAPISDEENEVIIGMICHIEADSPGGPRYNPMQSDDERQAFENLLLLCANHHKIIDSKPEIFTVARLKEIKADHEQRYANGIEPSNSIVAELLQSINNVNNITTIGSVTGPVVVSQNQMGGQTAYQIENYGLRPRQITQASGDALISELQKYPGEEFHIQCVAGDHEILDLAETLEAILVQAKWKDGGMSSVDRYPPLVRWGIRLFVPDSPGARYFLMWLTQNGFRVEPHIDEKNDSVTIQIGPNR